MYTVGLTGGIGSGKSAASAMFADLGAGVIDADLVSRELVQPGQPALQQIRQVFGDDVLNQQGELDRALLRERIFTRPDQRQHLEAIMHPLIHASLWQQARQSDAPYVILVVPLLYENQAHYPVERILLIDVPESIQRTRLKQRDRLDAAQINRMLASQSSRDQRLQIAHDIIRNTGALADLRDAVEHHHQHYMQMAHGAKQHS